MLARVFRHKRMMAVLIAVMARMAVFLALPAVFAFDQTGVIHGSDAYDRYAKNLNATGIYGLEPGVADAAIPPVYGYALAGIYRIFGRSSPAVAIFHILLDAMSIALLYAITRRLLRGIHSGDNTTWFSAENIAFFAALFYALYPYLIFQNLTLIDTALFMFLLHLFIFLMILLRERERIDRGTGALAIFAGFILGVTTLTRPITPPLAILLALWFLFRRDLIQSLLRLLPVAVVSLLVLVPWMIRNYRVFDAFVSMTTTSGANFWQGNSEWTIPVFRAGYDVQWTAPEGIPSTYADPQADAERFALALDFWRENPQTLPELFWTKFLVHWSIDVAPRFNPREGERFLLDAAGNLQVTQTDNSIEGVNAANAGYNEPLFDQIGRRAHQLYFGGLLLLALPGIVLSLPRWREVSLLWFTQISMTFVYVLFHPSTRYRAPTDPLLFIFSAFALVWLLQWSLQRRFARAKQQLKTAL